MASADYERSSSQYISTSGGGPIAVTGDFAIEFWWKPESLTNGEDQLFWSLNHVSGGELIRIYKSDDTVNPTLVAYIQEVPTAGPAADQHNEVTFALTGLVSAATWVHVALVCDIGNASATQFELYIDTVSQGNGTVTSGTDCSLIPTANGSVFLFGDGTDGVDGLVFDFRIWAAIKTALQISDNWEHTFLNSPGQSALGYNFYKGGPVPGTEYGLFNSRRHINHSGNVGTFTETGGPIAEDADEPPNMDLEVGVVDARADINGPVTVIPPSSDFAEETDAAIVTGLQGGTLPQDMPYFSGEGFQDVHPGSIQSHLQGGTLPQDMPYFSDFAFEAVNGILEQLSGTAQQAAFIYRMRATDTTLTRVVYWRSQSIDEFGNDYVGPGPLIEIVVSAVICQ
jgi:hypothetical protein